MLSVEESKEATVEEEPPNPNSHSGFLVLIDLVDSTRRKYPAEGRDGQISRIDDCNRDLGWYQEISQLLQSFYEKVILELSNGDMAVEPYCIVSHKNMGDGAFVFFKTTTSEVSKLKIIAYKIFTTVINYRHYVHMRLAPELEKRAKSNEGDMAKELPPFRIKIFMDYVENIFILETDLHFSVLKGGRAFTPEPDIKFVDVMGKQMDRAFRISSFATPQAITFSDSFYPYIFGEIENINRPRRERNLPLVLSVVRFRKNLKGVRKRDWPEICQVFDPQELCSFYKKTVESPTGDTQTITHKTDNPDATVLAEYFSHLPTLLGRATGEPSETSQPPVSSGPEI